jgi:hypothetical protein
VLIPILYLKGISTGDFEEALVALGARSRLDLYFRLTHWSWSMHEADGFVHGKMLSSQRH